MERPAQLSPSWADRHRADERLAREARTFNEWRRENRAAIEEWRRAEWADDTRDNGRHARHAIRFPDASTTRPAAWAAAIRVHDASTTRPVVLPRPRGTAVGFQHEEEHEYWEARWRIVWPIVVKLLCVWAWSERGVFPLG